MSRNEKAPVPGARFLTRWLSPAYGWRRLRHNLGPKLLSLGAAVALWLLSTGDQRAQVQQSYDVPITVRDTTGAASTNERRAVSDLNPETVRVTLTGRPERLNELRASNIEALLDVTGVPEGSFNRPVQIVAPSNTVLSKQTPERVQGFVDSALSRTLTVTLGVAAPAEDSLPRFEVKPGEVQATAPSRVLNQVTRVVTSPLSLAPGEKREAPLIALDSQGRVVEQVTLRPASVSVQRLDTGTLPVKALPVVLGSPPAGLRVVSQTLQPRTVRVVAAPELLGRLREVSGQVDYRVGSSTVPVTLRLPAGVQALEAVNVSLVVERVTAADPATGGTSQQKSSQQKSGQQKSGAAEASTSVSGNGN